MSTLPAPNLVALDCRPWTIGPQTVGPSRVSTLPAPNLVARNYRPLALARRLSGNYPVLVQGLSGTGPAAVRRLPGTCPVQIFPLIGAVFVFGLRALFELHCGRPGPPLGLPLGRLRLVFGPSSWVQPGASGAHLGVLLASSWGSWRSLGRTCLTPWHFLGLPGRTRALRRC